MAGAIVNNNNKLYLIKEGTILNGNQFSRANLSLPLGLIYAQCNRFGIVVIIHADPDLRISTIYLNKIKLHTKIKLTFKLLNIIFLRLRLS